MLRSLQVLSLVYWRYLLIFLGVICCPRNELCLCAVLGWQRSCGYTDTPYALRGSPASSNRHCWCFIQTFQVCTIHICNKFIYGNTSFPQNSPIFFCKTDFSQTFVSLDFAKESGIKDELFFYFRKIHADWWSSGRNWKIHSHHLLGTTGFGMFTKPKPESWPSWRGFSMSSIRIGTTGSSCEKIDQNLESVVFFDVWAWKYFCGKSRLVKYMLMEPKSSWPPGMLRKQCIFLRRRVR